MRADVAARDILGRRCGHQAARAEVRLNREPCPAVSTLLYCRRAGHPTHHSSATQLCAVGCSHGLSPARRARALPLAQQCSRLSIDPPTPMQSAQCRCHSRHGRWRVLQERVLYRTPRRREPSGRVPLVAHNHGRGDAPIPSSNSPRHHLLSPRLASPCKI